MDWSVQLRLDNGTMPNESSTLHPLAIATLPHRLKYIRYKSLGT